MDRMSNSFPLPSRLGHRSRDGGEWRRMCDQFGQAPQILSDGRQDEFVLGAARAS
jgi:hypothetical protein